MTMTNEQINSLAMFALEILEDWPEVGHLDMGDLQDIAEKHKILVPQIVHAPCDVDNCVCAEMCSDEDFARGVTCYHIADWLNPPCLTRDEAESPFVGASSICPSCGHMDGYHPPECMADDTPHS